MNINISGNPILSTGRVLFLAVLSMMSLQCINQPLAPIAPTWDVQISVPLVDTLRSVSEMVEKDTTVIQRDPVTNLISFSQTKQAVSDSIGDRIKLTPRASRLGVHIGELVVSDVQVGGSVASPVQGGPFPVFPAQTVRAGAMGAPPVQEFTSLNFQSGVAELTVTNNLPVSIFFPEPISITDGLGRVVATFTGLGTIDTGSSVTAVDSLTNRTTDNALRISTTPARDSITLDLSGGNNVTFTPQDNVAFSISFRNMVVSSATARIPTQNPFSEDSTLFQIDDSTFIQTALFKSGRFSVDLSNHVNLTVGTRLRLPQILNRFTGTVFDTFRTFAPFDSIRVDINLSQYMFQSPTPTRYVVYTARIEVVDSTDTNQVTVNANDSLLAVAVTADTFVVRSASGVIKPIEVLINQPFPLRLGDLPAKFTVDSLVLPDANFTLNLRTPVEARVSNMHFLARKGGLVDTIGFRTPGPVTLLPGIVNPVVFNDANSTIVQVLNRFVTSARTLPDSLRIFGDGLLNPNYDTTVARNVADTSKISGDVRVDFPLNVGIKNGTLRDTIDIADKINIQQEDLGRLNRGTLTFNVFNALPAALQLKAVMLDANGDSMWVFPRSGGIAINAASVGSDGFSNQSAQSIVPIALDRSDVQALVDATFLRFEVTLNTTQSVPSVKFRTSDTIRSRVYGTLSIRIGPGR